MVHIFNEILGKAPKFKTIELSGLAVKASKRFKMNYEKLRKLSDLRQQDELLAQARLEVQRQIDLAQMDLDIGSYFLNFDQNLGKTKSSFILLFLSPSFV